MLHTRPTRAGLWTGAAQRVRVLLAALFLCGCAGCAPQRDLSPPAGGAPAARQAPPAAPTADAAASACARMGGFTLGVTGSCYMLGDYVFTWHDARSYCQAWGGELVAIGSHAENAALAALIEQSVWIGANDQQEEGVFRWVGGELLPYMRWSNNQPDDLEGNEDCSELRAFDQQWSDVPCSGDHSRRALCERPPA